MPSHIAFISLFLGIVSGKQPIDLRADAEVKSIRIVLGGQEIARLTQPPWQTEIDLGPELVPRELQAIGYDDQGDEIGRASQLLNVPRPNAEVEVTLERKEGFPIAARLHWRNLEYVPPKSAAMTFDGLPLKVDSHFRAQFPKTDWMRPHVVEVQMRFSDGMIARREVVIDGATFSDTARAELTPILLSEASPHHPASYERCFSLDGAPVRTAAVEKEGATVIFVRDPDSREIMRTLDPARRASNIYTRAEVRRWAQLDADTTQQLLWPVAQQFIDRSTRESSLLFAHTREVESREGLMMLLTIDAHLSDDKPPQFADAVAVAGIRAVADGRRRAVVYVVSNRPDASRSDPRFVRRYLASIGVPLFVWSPTGPRPDLADKWGPVDDISSVDLLRAAAARVRKTLAAQRIAWVHADALNALRVKADERCGVFTVASQ